MFSLLESSVRRGSLRGIYPPPPKKTKKQKKVFTLEVSFFSQLFFVDSNLQKLSSLLIGHNKHTQSVEGRMINTGWEKKQTDKIFW